MGNREKLLEGAKKCLFEKGYGATTVRDIASAAGVSMAAIGYHFGSKEALLNEALFRSMDEGDSAMGMAFSRIDPNSSPAEQAEAMWSGLIESFATHRTFWLASMEAAVQAQHVPELRPQLADGQRQGRSGMAAVLTGLEENGLDPAVVRTLGSVQLALIGGVMMQWLTDPEAAPTAAEIVEGIQALAKLTGGDL